MRKSPRTAGTASAVRGGVDPAPARVGDETGGPRGRRRGRTPAPPGTRPVRRRSPGMPGQELWPVRPPSGVQGGLVLAQRRDHPRVAVARVGSAVGGGRARFRFDRRQFIHGIFPSTSRSRASARAQSFSTPSARAAHPPGHLRQAQPFHVVQDDHLAVVLRQPLQGVGQEDRLLPSGCLLAGRAARGDDEPAEASGGLVEFGRPGPAPAARPGAGRRGSGGPARRASRPGSAAASRAVRPRSGRGTAGIRGPLRGTPPGPRRRGRPCPGVDGRSAAGRAASGRPGTVRAAGRGRPGHRSAARPIRQPFSGPCVSMTPSPPGFIDAETARVPTLKPKKSGLMKMVLRRCWSRLRIHPGGSAGGHFASEFDHVASAAAWRPRKPLHARPHFSPNSSSDGVACGSEDL